jgi:hypothetical protein
MPRRRRARLRARRTLAGERPPLARAARRHAGSGRLLGDLDGIAHGLAPAVAHNAVFDPGYPRVQAISCDDGAPFDEIEDTTTANASGLTYDAASDTYSYVWKTDPAWAGSCRRLVVALGDATRHEADFKLR